VKNRVVRDAAEETFADEVSRATHGAVGENVREADRQLLGKDLEYVG